MGLNYPEIDPVIFSFYIGTIQFALRWYALSYIAGILVAWKLMQILCKKYSLWSKNKPPLNPQAVDDLMTYLIVGIILGGRLGYVCFYQPNFFFQNPFEILKIWNGGMSFHGGFLGVVLGTVIYAKKNKIDLMHLGDLIAIASPPGLFFGRIANFINGELWGKATTSPWGMVFPANNAKVCPENWVGACTRHPSQLYEAALEGFALWIVLLTFVFIFKSLKRRSEIFCIFLIGYGVSRAIIELYREPDAQFITTSNPNGYIIFITESLGFSMGQILCLPMIIVGITLLFVNHFATKKFDK